MENRNIVYTGGGVIMILLFLTIFGFVSNAKNKNNLENEQLQTENLTRHLQQVLDERDSVIFELKSLSTENDSVNRMLAESEDRVAMGSRRISSLSRDNKELTGVREEFEELQKSKAELDNTYADLQLKHKEVLAQNNELQNSLKATETQRSDVMGRFEYATLYNADNFLVTATRGAKDKVVACASRAKRLNASFEVPQNLTDSITYNIETPSGTIINPEAYIFPENDHNLTAGLTGLNQVINNPRKVRLTYDVEDKLEKGEYKIQFISNGNNIGNCRLILR
jgi:hypothetical protein